MRTGFTLMEPLAVISAIAIVAAILSPVFATAREDANQTSFPPAMLRPGRSNGEAGCSLPDTITNGGRTMG